MFCKKCGKENAEGTKFCRFCGENMAVQQPAGSQVKKRGLSPVLAFVLGMALIAALGAALFAGGLLRFGGSGKKTTRVEGDGFETPEAAITAYAEALQAQDVERMISCFAVESYAENYDAVKACERMGVIMPQDALWNKPLAPTESDFVAKLNVEKRRSEVLDVIVRHSVVLAYYSGGEGNEGFYDAMQMIPVTYSDLDDAEKERAIRETLQAMQTIPDLSAMQIGTTYEPYELSNNYLNTANLRQIKRSADTFNAEGVKSVALMPTLNGRTFILTLDAVRFQGRWYLLGAGNLSILLNTDTYHGGLVPKDEVEELSAGSWDWAEIQAEAQSELETYLDLYDESEAEVQAEIREELESELGMSSMQEVADYYAIPQLADIPYFPDF